MKRHFIKSITIVAVCTFPFLACISTDKTKVSDAEINNQLMCSINYHYTINYTSTKTG